MNIRSKNFVLKLEEILKEELPTERYNEHEKFVLKIIRNWHANTQLFTHQTSGSTGRPKKIDISRDKIEMSARATLSYIDPYDKIKTSMLCLNPKHIGGAMVVYRSLIYNHDLTIVDPSTDLSKAIEHNSFDLVSMVPLQFGKLTESQLNQFGTILIGGAPLKVQSVRSTAKVYSTFGMTETVSHIALRPIDKDEFTTTGDTIVEADEYQTLKIKGKITDHKWLITNDIVSTTSPKSFKWVGRKDFVINSGGIKVNPEDLEQKLEPQIADEFIIGSIPDADLGQKVVLISEGSERPIDFSSLDKYHRPKVCFYNQEIFRTSSGKIDRKKTIEHLEKKL